MSITIQVVHNMGHIFYLEIFLTKFQLSLNLTDPFFKSDRGRKGVRCAVWKLVSVVIRAHFVPEREMANDDDDADEVQ